MPPNEFAGAIVPCPSPSGDGKSLEVIADVSGELIDRDVTLGGLFAQGFEQDEIKIATQPLLEAMGRGFSGAAYGFRGSARVS